MIDVRGLSRHQAAKVSAAIAACGTVLLLAAKWRTIVGKAKASALATENRAEPKELRGSTSDAEATATGSTSDAEASGPISDLEDLDGDADASRPQALGLGEVLRPTRRTVQSGRDKSSGAPHLPGAQRIYVRTFGCPHNQSDGEYMMGQLRDYGYTLVDSVEECDACVVNSCTVKHPSEVRGINLVEKAQEAGKRVVLAGCVPSSDKKLAESMEDVSMLDVTQLDRIVEVVEESIKGHTVKLLQKRKGLPSLALPKVRRDKLSEIITINAGCLGNCTYCKTKLSRGKVVSYPIDEIVDRALEAAAEGVCQIELASEDMGAYGTDIGTNIVELLLRLSDTLPPGVMLRTGMTNPPYILHHIDGIIEALKRPNVHAFMHIPVQSGSDATLRSMRREYTVAEFSYLADRLKAAVPDVFLLTDIICGFPSESQEDWEATMALCRKYNFHGIHISQFYARPNTPAARMKPLKSHVGKDRYRELNDYTWTYDRNEGFRGREERVWFTGTDVEHGQTIGRTKAFAKVLVQRDDTLLGRSATVRISETSRLHVSGEVLGDLL